jgi:hypothetical protein
MDFHGDPQGKRDYGFVWRRADGGGAIVSAKFIDGHGEAIVEVAGKSPTVTRWDADPPPMIVHMMAGMTNLFTLLH